MRTLENHIAKSLRLRIEKELKERMRLGAINFGNLNYDQINLDYLCIPTGKILKDAKNGQIKVIDILFELRKAIVDVLVEHLYENEIEKFYEKVSGISDAADPNLKKT